MSNKYKVTSYYRGPRYIYDEERAVDLAREWAIKTNSWGKVEQVIVSRVKRPDTVKQVYICGLHTGRLTESFNEI